MANGAEQLEILQTVVAARINRSDVVNMGVDQKLHIVFEIPNLARIAKKSATYSAAMLLALAFAVVS